MWGGRRPERPPTAFKAAWLGVCWRMLFYVRVSIECSCDDGWGDPPHGANNPCCAFFLVIAANGSGLTLHALLAVRSPISGLVRLFAALGARPFAT